MADGHLTMTRQLCHNTWLVFKLIHKRTRACLRSLTQANVPNTAALLSKWTSVTTCSLVELTAPPLTPTTHQ